VAINADYASTGPVDPEFQVEGVAPTNHSFSHKTRVNDLSHGINIWTDFSFVLSQFTRLTDGRTEGQTDRNLIARPRLHSMQRCNNRSKTVSVCLYVNQGDTITQLITATDVIMHAQTY